MNSHGIKKNLSIDSTRIILNIIAMSNNIEIMGVLNITDDSFYDGGKYSNLKSSINQVRNFLDNKVDIIDIGAESSRPGAKPVSEDLQINKIEPVISEIRKFSNIKISLDTRSSKVVRELLKYKIDIVNDISSLQDRNLLDVIKSNSLTVSLMHMQGTPENMQDNPVYENVLSEIYNYLENKIQLCMDYGIKKENIIIDPGFGFGKTLNDNYAILNNLDKFNKLGCKVLAGISRKSMIGDVLNKPPAERLYGTLAASAIAIKKSVSILRVHDVRETQMLLKFKEFFKS